MAERRAVPESGDALFAFDGDLRVVSWNDAAEELTSVTAADALGRPCWAILAGKDEAGHVVCHQRCRDARLARAGAPPTRRRVRVRGTDRPVWLSTIALPGERPLVLHLMTPAGPERPLPGSGQRPRLTPRQAEVLALLAAGLPVKRIAGRLGIAETTTRNHVRALLRALGAHSQLEAVARARQVGFV